MPNKAIVHTFWLTGWRLLAPFLIRYAWHPVFGIGMDRYLNDSKTAYIYVFNFIFVQLKVKVNHA